MIKSIQLIQIDFQGIGFQQTDFWQVDLGRVLVLSSCWRFRDVTTPVKGHTAKYWESWISKTSMSHYRAHTLSSSHTHVCLETLPTIHRPLISLPKVVFFFFFYIQRSCLPFCRLPNSTCPQ